MSDFSLFGRDLFGEPIRGKASGPLAQAFVLPPFSVLDARQGVWQDRKRAWLSLGLKSEIGRGGKLCFGSIAQAKDMGRTSVFDPVLCELSYRWFCPPNGAILDPFAGGSVRGVVASLLGRSYTGIDLRSEQIKANRVQGATLCSSPAPRWIEGDSRDVAALAPEPCDLVFSCPPYADLEHYSDDPRDLSTLDYPTFLAAYRAIIAAACSCLRPDRFACFVVGDVRDESGLYRNFVGDTVEAFEAAGLGYYNEAILVTRAGSLPFRARKQFAAGRKLGKTHQNVLVFVKGDGKRAAQACGKIEAESA